MFNWIKLNYEHIFSVWYKCITIISFLLGSVASFPSCIKNVIWMKSIVLIAIGLLILVIVFLILYRKDSVLIWKRGNYYVESHCDDLFKIALNKTNKKKFIVIPVNTTFDTIVDSPGIIHPLVSVNTLHGQWINRCHEWGLSLKSIDEQIKNTLSRVPVIKELDKTDKKRGNLLEYPVGTIVPVEGECNTIFLLTALSVFDEKNNAHTTSEDLSKVIKSIVRYVDENGQGTPIYLPVMGTGLSRMNLGKNEAFHLMKYELLACSSRIHSKFTIVIYTDDKNEISIWD